MAQYTQVGSPKQLITTTPAKTITDIVEGEISFDPELEKHFNGNSVFPRFTIGNHTVRVRARTTDITAMDSYIKGLEVAGLQLQFNGTYTAIAASGSLTQAAGTVGITISTARVVEAVAISNNADKKPAEFELVFEACQKEADGTDPTITIDATPGS